MNIKGCNQDSNKIDNKRLVLKILQRKSRISRIELAALTGLTKATISNIVNDLLKQGLVIETGSIHTSCGRKPVLIEINSDFYSLAGVYISRDFFHTVVTDFNGIIIAQNRQNIDQGKPCTEILRDIIKSLRSILYSAKAPLLGIGITTVGVPDPNRRKILTPTGFTGWRDVPITDILEKEFNKPVYLENDCNACALAERLIGQFRDTNDLVYLGVENGVGLGLVINGKLYKGSNGFAAEIGHITVDISGKRCECGNIGCLENYLMLNTIVDRVKSGLGAGKVPNYTDIDWRWIVDSALSGNEVCKNAVLSVIPYLALALVNTINIFDPSVIVLGHDIILAEDLIYNPLMEELRNRYFSREHKEVKICISSFKNYTPVMGSIALVLDDYFNVN